MYQRRLMVWHLHFHWAAKTTAVPDNSTA